MSILRECIAYNRQQKVIILACLALFLPFYITCIIDLVLLIYCLIKKDLQKAYKSVDKAFWIFPFTALSVAVSLLYHNYIGVMCNLGILVIFSMVIFYQCYGDAQLFRRILKLIVLMSILCAIYGMMEYNGILRKLGVEEFEVIVFDNPKSRLNSVFFNANYYAMMLEFFCIIIVYLILYEKKASRLLCYVCVLAMNLFILYLTGCRTAWPALATGVFVLVLFYEDRRLLYILLILGAILMLMFLIEPSLFPRSDNILKYFLNRTKIWKVAIDNIKHHLLFGQGPLTYMLVYPNYPQAIETQHAHNIFLDPILCYGVIGIGLIFPYFKARYNEWKLCSNQHDTKVLVKAFLMATLVHGVLDYTIYFVPTGFMFLMILSSTFTIKQAKEQ